MNMVANQRVANQNRTSHSMRDLIPALLAMSEPERFAFLTRIAAAAAIPAELVFLGESGDQHLVASILDGVLLKGHDTYTWQTHSGCEARVVMLPGTEYLHE